MATKLISVPVATAIGLGAIIGAGIFVLSGTAIALAGPEALISFIIVGIIALLIALQLGELGSIMPLAQGASYSYVYSALGSEMGFITGLLFYFSFATSISVVALGFGSYLASILGMQSSSAVYFAICLIFALAALNLAGIGKAAKADSALVAIKLGILIIFIAFAFAVAFVYGHFSQSNFLIYPQTSGIAAIFAASVVVFFAYSGFQSISTLTPNIRGGAIGAAKAILAAVSISMVIYVLVALSLILLAPASSYTVSGDPLSFALQSSGAPGYLFILVSIGALIATASATLAMLLSSSRIMRQISADHLLPHALSKYDKKSGASYNAILVSAFIGIVMLFSGNIYIIAAIANFGLLFSYIMSSVSLIHFRRLGKAGSVASPFYPYLPIITIASLLVLMSGMPYESLLIGIISVMCLITVYYSLREIRGKKVIRIKLFD
jgi:APA family basic amino acid/polyamine antiporter